MSKASCPKWNYLQCILQVEINEWVTTVWEKKKDGKWRRWFLCLPFVKMILSMHFSLPTGQRIFTSTNRHKSKGSEFVKLSQIYKTAIFNDVSFFHTKWPLHGNRSVFFFFSSGFRKLLEGKSNILSWWGDRRGADMPTGRGSWEKPQTGRAWLTLTREVKAGGSATERCFQATLRLS